MTIIPILGLLVGLAVSGLLIWDGLRSVVNHKYCEVFSDDFSSWNDKVWTKEVEVGGYGYVRLVLCYAIHSFVTVMDSLR